jgi:hypothetical protein
MEREWQFQDAFGCDEKLIVIVTRRRISSTTTSTSSIIFASSTCSIRIIVDALFGQCS